MVVRPEVHRGRTMIPRLKFSIFSYLFFLHSFITVFFTLMCIISVDCIAYRQNKWTKSDFSCWYIMNNPGNIIQRLNSNQSLK